LTYFFPLLTPIFSPTSLDPEGSSEGVPDSHAAERLKNPSAGEDTMEGALDLYAESDENFENFGQVSLNHQCFSFSNY
jgi:hypothetical protein